jgi:hypothetical protein
VPRGRAVPRGSAGEPVPPPNPAPRAHAPAAVTRLGLPDQLLECSTLLAGDAPAGRKRARQGQGAPADAAGHAGAAEGPRAAAVLPVRLRGPRPQPRALRGPAAPPGAEVRAQVRCVRVATVPAAALWGDWLVGGAPARARSAHMGGEAEGGGGGGGERRVGGGERRGRGRGGPPLSRDEGPRARRLRLTLELPSAGGATAGAGGDRGGRGGQGAGRKASGGVARSPRPDPLNSSAAQVSAWETETSLSPLARGESFLLA